MAGIYIVKILCIDSWKMHPFLLYYEHAFDAACIYVVFHKKIIFTLPLCELKHMSYFDIF